MITQSVSTKDKWLKILGVLSAQLAIIWAVFSGIEVLLLTVLPNTIMHIEHMPAQMRNLLLCREISLLALAVLVAAGPVLILGWFWSSQNRIIRRIRRILALLFTITVLSIYFSSWFLYSSTGRFLDLDGIGFFAVNNIQLLQHVVHMEPYSFIFVIVLTILSAVTVIYFLAKVSRLNPGSILFINLIGLICLIISLATARWGADSQFNTISPVLDPEAGEMYTVKDLFTKSIADSSGPILHGWMALRFRFFEEEEQIDVSGNISITRRPIITMDKYLDVIDKERFRRWNVIVVIVESLRTDQLRAGGSNRDVMPNLEMLASEGTVFINNYTQSSHSNYSDICPLSSHYPLRSPWTHVYPENPTYPRVLIYDVLKKLGYNTSVISSQNEDWGKMINYLQTGNIDHFFHSKTFDGPTYIPRHDRGFTNFVKGNKRSGKIDDRFTIAEAIRWIDTHKQKPYFTYINLQSSHIPYETPADFPRRFGKEKLPFVIRFNNFPPDQAGLVKDVYANSLSYVDFQLGKLIGYLKNSGQWNNTIIAVTGDTGQAFYEHGFAAHANMVFNEVMLVPIVLRAPGLSHSVDNKPAQHIDLPPTIFDILNLPSHPSFQGVSLYETVNDEKSIYLTAQTPLAHQYAIVRSGFKYIYDANLKIEMLLNLKVDPAEKRNCIKQFPGVAKALRDRLNTWRKTQISYYQNVSQHYKWYPPVLNE